MEVISVGFLCREFRSFHGLRRRVNIFCLLGDVSRPAVVLTRRGLGVALDSAAGYAAVRSCVAQQVPLQIRHID